MALLSGALLWRLLVEGEELGALGLAGVFTAAMLSHLTVVARDMFIPLFLPLTKSYHPVVLGASTGLGAALGEVATYFLGWGLAESLADEYGLEDRVAHWIGKYGLLAVLLVSITPLPDTPIVLLAGSRRFPFTKLALVEALGKTILYSTAAMFGGFIYLGMEGALGSTASPIIVVAGSILLSVAVTWKPSRDRLFSLLERFLA